ncbi:hypothetical protein [Paenibacillus whitsoniae]|uniref:Radical SAM protein n=1 Tax=Paenibacillus whitsoniae TaxID=2496558 RepID=A0A430J7J5_9BACL|nr:hypothetical protein [Paenibacillus whitsoniae]RTE05506.1 hypothetical protein EJQ19_25125 [Paenibacillus whitsoniae]
MRIGILDIDSEMKADNRGIKRKYPNVACGKIYGYHKVAGDEVIYPWKGQKVDKLYISTIFTSTKPAILRQMPLYQAMAKEVFIGGSGWDDYSKKPYVITKLPKEIQDFDDPKWLYEMYDIDYGIGFTTRGCSVNCSFCLVSKKEGAIEYADTPITKIVNPKSKHIVLMNNNSIAHDDFWADVAEIKARGLSIHWDQANDITLVTPKVAEALGCVNYRSFNGSDKELKFAFDLLVRRKGIVLETASHNSLNALDLDLDKDGFYFIDNGPEFNSPKGMRLLLDTRYENIHGDISMIAKQAENRLTGELETVMTITYNMMKLVPRKIRLMQEYGIEPYHLMFYVLIGFNTTEDEDIARIEILKEFRSRPYPMLFRDLTGKAGVDGSGKPQSFHCRPFRDWVVTGLYKKQAFHDFTRYHLRKKQAEEKLLQQETEEHQLSLF